MLTESTLHCLVFAVGVVTSIVATNLFGYEGQWSEAALMVGFVVAVTARLHFHWASTRVDRSFTRLAYVLSLVLFGLGFHSQLSASLPTISLVVVLAGVPFVSCVASFSPVGPIFIVKNRDTALS